MTRTHHRARGLRFAFACLTLALVLPACSGGKKEEPKAAAPAPAAPKAAPAAAPAAPMDPEAAKAEATQLYTTICVTCHGQSGKGDGPASAGLSPKPRDLTSPDWQTSVTDEHIEKIIVYGGIAVGLSAAMPANPNLDSKPEVVKALVEHVRNLGK